MTHLPLEILIMICDHLQNLRDFQALFALALSGKLLTKIALQRLYRIHTESEVFGRADHKKEGFGTPARPGCRYRAVEDTLRYRSYIRKQYFPRRKILWKSIIFSGFGNTAFPYCLYIRSLNLNFQDFKIYANFCHDTHPDTLYAAEMKGLVTYKDYCYVPNSCLNFIDFYKTSELIQDFLLTYICEASKNFGTKVQLESLTWHGDAKLLTKWISHFPKLKALAISSGASNLEDLAEAISYNCLEFQSLRVIVESWSNREKADSIIAQFLSGLNQDTLQKFTTVIDDNYNNFSFGPRTLYALNHHIKSLTSLKFCHLSPDTTENLYLLYECKGLISLQFSLSHLDRLELTDNELFQDIIEWICSCRGLRELSVGDSLDGTSIVTRVCKKKRIHLQKIEVTAMAFLDSDDFFSVLPYHNSSIEYLRIGGNVTTCEKIASRNLRSAIPHMKNLKYLDISTFCSNRSHGAGYDLVTIITVVKDLSKLEELVFWCTNTSDRLWPTLTNLRHLKILKINGISEFTFEGILKYIVSLHDTNKGLDMSVMIRDGVRSMDKMTRKFIRHIIRDRVGGNFELEYF